MTAAVTIALQLFISRLSGLVARRDFAAGERGTAWLYLTCSATWFAGAAHDIWRLQ